MDDALICQRFDDGSGNAELLESRGRCVFGSGFSISHVAVSRACLHGGISMAQNHAVVKFSLNPPIFRCCASPGVRAGCVVLSQRTPVRFLRPPCHRTRQVPLATRPIGGSRLILNTDQRKKALDAIVQ